MRTIRDILSLLPASIKSSFEDYRTPLSLDRTYFETEGDIEDLIALIVNDLQGLQHFQGKTNIEFFNNLKQLALVSYGMISYNEFKTMEPFTLFQKYYPNLAHTIIIWAWS